MEIQMIYYLHEDAKENAMLLDDKMLARQIKAIAQVLCNEHHRIALEELEYRCRNGVSRYEVIDYAKGIPLHLKMDSCTYEWGGWIKKCLANYKNLVEMGLACCEEYTYRFSETGFTAADVFYHGIVKKHKLQPVIEWAASHIPNLPE